MHQLSKKHVKARYEKMLGLYNQPVQDRFNCYVCICGHITKTVDLHMGVIPMFFKCEQCGGQGTSTYFNDIAPTQQATIEWYRPTLQEALNMRSKFPSLLEHVLNGGLCNRKVKPKPTINETT